MRFNRKRNELVVEWVYLLILFYIFIFILILEIYVWIKGSRFRKLNELKLLFNMIFWDFKVYIKDNLEWIGYVDSLENFVF